MLLFNDIKVWHGWNGVGKTWVDCLSCIVCHCSTIGWRHIIFRLWWLRIMNFGCIICNSINSWPTSIYTKQIIPLLLANEEIVLIIFQLFPVLLIDDCIMESWVINLSRWRSYYFWIKPWKFNPLPHPLSIDHIFESAFCCL